MRSVQETFWFRNDRGRAVLLAYGLGVRGTGSGFRVQEVRSRFQGLEFEVLGPELQVEG